MVSTTGTFYVILLTFIKVITAAPIGSLQTGLHRHGVAAHRHSFLEAPQPKLVDCWTRTNFAFCNFDPQLGTGCCQETDLVNIRRRLKQDDATTTKIIRNLAPQPLVPFPANRFSSEFRALQYGPPPNQWKIRDMNEQTQGALYVIDNFLSSQDAEALIKYARGQGEARQSGVRAGPVRHCEFRRSSSWGVSSSNQIVPGLAEKLAAVANTQVKALEYTQLTKYNPGDFYSDHYDEDPCDQQIRDMDRANKIDDSARNCDELRRRATTILIYLNDVTDGSGSTYFPRLNTRISPKQGTAIIFHPTLKNGWTNPLLLHGSEELNKNEKFVIQQWIGRNNGNND